MATVQETAIVYAALILQDDNVEITADKLKAILDAANVEVELIWCKVYADVLAKLDLNEILMSVASAPAAGAAAAPIAAAGAPAAAGKAEEKKEVKKEESDEDMGFGLFD